jgi:hypothetical protein
VRGTVSVHLHAGVDLLGPDFHGSATIDLDVTSVTVAFGDAADGSTPKLAWPDFAEKYLKAGGAAVLTAVPGRGALPPGTGESTSAPTGGLADPYLLLPEFVLTVTTTAATSAVDADGPVALADPVFLAVGPMQVGAVTSTLSVSVTSAAGREHVRSLAPTPVTGHVPAGVWGPQPTSEPKPVPTGETVPAVTGVTLTAEARIPAGTVEIDSAQVETGARHQLPFLAEAAVRGERAVDVAAAAALAAAEPSTVDAVLAQAGQLLASGPNGRPPTPLAAATFASSRVAPPQLVPLTLGMAVDPGPPVPVPAAPGPPTPSPVDLAAHPLRFDAMLAGTPVAATAQVRTSVGQAGTGLPRVIPARLAEAAADLDPLVPVRLVTATATATAPATHTPVPAPGRGSVAAAGSGPDAAGTVLAAGRVPYTGRAGTGSELRRAPGLAPWRARRLAVLTEGLAGAGVDLLGGEVALLSTGNGLRDVLAARPVLQVSGDLPVRVVVLDIAGAVTLDDAVRNGQVALPRHTGQVVLLGGAAAPGRGSGPDDPAGATAMAPDGAAGWHSGSRLVQANRRTLIGPACTLTSTAVRTRRGALPVGAAFVTAAAAVAGYSVVTTRLPADVTAVAVALETGAGEADARTGALELGLTGARRAVGPDGIPAPARIVVTGSRTVAVYPVVPEGDVPVEVTVASGERLHLAGVLGGTAGAPALAEALRRRDVPGVLSAAVGTPAGRATVRWRAQVDPRQEG